MGDITKLVDAFSPQDNNPPTDTTGDAQYYKDVFGEVPNNQPSVTPTPVPTPIKPVKAPDLNLSVGPVPKLNINQGSNDAMDRSTMSVGSIPKFNVNQGFNDAMNRSTMSTPDKAADQLKTLKEKNPDAQEFANDYNDADFFDRMRRTVLPTDQEQNYKNYQDQATPLEETIRQSKLAPLQNEIQEQQKQIESLSQTIPTSIPTPTLGYPYSSPVSDENQINRDKISTAQSFLGEALKNVQSNKGMKMDASTWTVPFLEKTLSLGFSDVFNLGSLLGVKNKIDNKQPLDDYDKALLQAAFIKQTSESVTDPSVAYKMINAIPDNLGFMLSMVGTEGIAGSVEKLSQGLATRLAENVSSNVGKQIIEKGVGKVLGGATADLARLPFTSMPYDETLKNYTGQVTGTPTGDLTLDNGDTFGRSLVKGLNNSFAAYVFMRLPEPISKVTGSLIEKTPLNQVGAFFGNFFEGKTPGAASQFYKEFTDASKYHGFAGMMGSMYAKDLYTGATGTGPSLNQFLDSKYHKDMFISSLGLAMGFGILKKLAAASGSVMDWNASNDINNQFKTVDPNIQTLVDNAMSHPDYNSRWEALRKIDYSGLSKEDQGKVWNYAQDKIKTDLYTGWKEDQTSQESEPLRNETTGDIHPVGIKNETDSEAPLIPGFVVGDIDDGLSYVYDPQQQKVVPVDPKLLDRQQPIKFDDWVKTNTDISLQQEQETAAQQQVQSKIQEGNTVNYNGKSFVVSGLSGDLAQLDEVDQDGNIMDNGQSGNVPVAELMNQNQPAQPIPSAQPEVTNQVQPTDTNIPGQQVPEQNTTEQPAQSTQETGQVPAEQVTPPAPSFDVKLKEEQSKAISQPDGTFKVEKAFDTEAEALKEIKYLNDKLGKRGFTFSTEETLADPNNPFSDSYHQIIIHPKTESTPEMANSNNQNLENHGTTEIGNRTTVQEPGKQVIQGKGSNGSGSTGSLNRSQEVRNGEVQQTKPERQKVNEKGGQDETKNNVQTKTQTGQVAPQTNETTGKNEFVGTSPAVSEKISDLENNKPLIGERIIKPEPNEPGFNTWVADHSTDPEEVHTSWLDEKEKAPYQKLDPWEQQLLKLRVEPTGFYDIVGNQGEGIIPHWFSNKPEDRIDLVAQQLSENNNIDVTPHMIADFMVENPTKNVRKTTNIQHLLERRYKKLTGESLITYQKKLNAQTPTSELDNFLNENNLENSWFNPDQLIHLLDENRSKLTDEQYNRFVSIAEKIAEPSGDIYGWDEQVVSPESDFGSPGSSGENNDTAGNGVNSEPERINQEPEQAETTPPLSSTQQVELNKKLSEIDGQIKSVNDAISNTQKAKSKKFVELNQRNGLFGDTSQQENQMSMGTFSPSQENVKKVLEKYDGEIRVANEQLDRLKKLRQNTIDNAGKQQEINIEESKVNTEPSEAIKVEVPAEVNPIPEPKPKFAGELFEPKPKRLTFEQKFEKVQRDQEKFRNEPTVDNWTARDKELEAEREQAKPKYVGEIFEPKQEAHKPITFRYSDGVIRTGTIEETLPDGKLKIKAEDGNVFRVKPEMVLKDNNSDKIEETIQSKIEPIKSDILPKRFVGEVFEPTIKNESGNIPESFTLKSFGDFSKDLSDGKVGIDDFKKAFQVLLSSKDIIIGELQSKTKAELLKNMSSYGLSRYKNETKERVINALWNDNLMTFSFGSVSMDMNTKLEDAIKAKVNKTTQQDIDNHVIETKKRIEDYKKRLEAFRKSLTNPETLDEFKEFIKKNGIDKLTPEQKIKYDDLITDKVQGERKSDQERKAEISKVEIGDTSMKLIETKHTKTEEPLFVVQMSDRVSPETYKDLNSKAKQLGGYYSSFRGNGAIPGFTFKDKSQAEKFISLREGDVSNVDALEKKTENKKESIALKLREAANKVIEAANEELGKERQTNTYKRANQANHSEAKAEESKRIGQTMLNISKAIENGDVKLLDSIKAKTQIDLLDMLVRSAKRDEVQAKNDKIGYDERQSLEATPPTVETIEHLRHGFYPKIYGENLKDLVNKAENINGVRRIATRWQNKLARLGSYDSYQTVNSSEVDEISDMFNALPESDKRYNRIGDELANYKRLKAMGIENDSMLRAALREYVQYRGGDIEENKIKQLERAIVGKKVGFDFFPTPSNVAETMVNEAGVTKGMDVLEPSAGNGNIADAIKDTGVIPDTIELSSDLSKILEAKGYPVVGSDFMKYDGKKYDRIIMNPPFSNGMDGEHVQHAYDLLKPGGRLVAIVGEGTFFRGDKKATAFRDWLESVNGSEERLPDKTFSDKKLLNTTNANARIVIIDKPTMVLNDKESDESNPDIRFKNDYVSQINSKPLTRVEGLQMGQNQAKGIYISTEEKNRYETDTNKAKPVQVNIKNPIIFDQNKNDFSDFQWNTLNQNKSQFTADDFENGIPKGEINVDQLNKQGSDKLAQLVTDNLKNKGFDSIYFNGDGENELVVFDHKNVMGGQPMFKEKEGVSFTKDVDKRQSEIQHYYDSIGRGAEITAIKTTDESIQAYKDQGGESINMAEHLRGINLDFTGVFLPDIKAIQVNSNQVRAKEDANSVWLHEHIHFSINTMLPRKESADLMNKIYNSLGENQVNMLVPEYYRDEAPYKQAEEYLAYKTEHEFKNGAIDIKNRFTPEEINDLLAQEKISDDDISKLINTFVHNAYTQPVLKNEKDIHKTGSSDRGTTGTDDSIALSFGRRIGAPDKIQENGNVGNGSIQGNEKGNTREPSPRYVGDHFKPQVETQNFKNWFGNSKLTDTEGNPTVMYHGTGGDFNSFQPNDKGLIFAAPSSEFAEKGFMPLDPDKGTSGSVMPVYVKSEHPFDYRNPEDIQKLFSKLGDIRQSVKDNIERGDPMGIENKRVVPVIKELGYDGLYVNEQGNVNVGVFNPAQIKSAIGNSGEFNPNTVDIRYKKADAIQPELPGFLPPEPPRKTPGGNDFVGDKFEENPKPFKPFVNTWTDRQIENFQNKMLSAKRLVDEVQKRVGKISDGANPYQEENLSAGRVKTFMDNYEKDHLEPLLHTVSEFTKGKNLDEIQTYLMAKHAPERNDYISKQKEDLTYNNDYSGIASIKTDFDKTGMTPDAIANRIVDEFESKFKPDQIERLWKAVNDNTDFTLDQWLKYGFIDKATYDAMKERYKNYVPLRGWELTDEDKLHEYTSNNSGKEFNLIKKAKGRTSQAEGPLQYMANMANTAIVSGERNTVKQAAWRLAKSYPNMKDLFTMKKVYLVDTQQKNPETGNEIWQEQVEKPTQEQFDNGLVKVKTNSKHMERKPMSQAKEHEVEAMVNGEKFVVVFKDENLGRAINNNQLDDKALHIQLAFQQSIGSFTRWLSSNFTAKNPAFMPINTMRDMGYAVSSYLVKDGFVDAYKFAANAGFLAPIPLIGRIGSHSKLAIIRNLAGKFDPNNKYDVWYKEFKENGGETGFIHLKDVDYFKHQIEREIKRANKDNSYWDKMTQARVFKYAGDVLEHYAIRSENVSRFAAFIVSREKGKTAKESAYDAKEITVNFNRKGKYSSMLGSIYAFFNASVQGGANVVGLAQKNPKAFTAMSLGFMSLGIMSSVLNSMWGDDDDDSYGALSDFMKQNFLVIPGLGKGQFITMPMPHGFRSFYGLGVMAYQHHTGQKKISDLVPEATSNFMNSLSPIDFTDAFFPKKGASLEKFRPLTPTVLVPWLDLADNTDFAQRQIYKEPFTKALEDKTADVSLGLKSVNPYLKGGLQKLFQVGHGDLNTMSKLYMDDDGNIQHVNEAFDWNPSKVEHLFEYYLGGRGTFFNDVIKTSTMIAKGAYDASKGNEVEKFDFNQVPVLKRLYKEPIIKSSEEQYWDAKNQVSDFDYLESQYKKSNDPDKIMSLYKNKELVNKIMTFKAYDDQVKKINEDMAKVTDPNMTMFLMSRKKELIQQCINAIK